MTVMVPLVQVGERMDIVARWLVLRGHRSGFSSNGGPYDTDPLRPGTLAGPTPNSRSTTNCNSSNDANKVNLATSVTTTPPIVIVTMPPATIPRLQTLSAVVMGMVTGVVGLGAPPSNAYNTQRANNSNSTSTSKALTSHPRSLAGQRPRNCLTSMEADWVVAAAAVVLEVPRQNRSRGAIVGTTWTRRGRSKRITLGRLYFHFTVYCQLLW